MNELLLWNTKMNNFAAISCRKQVVYWWDEDGDDVHFVLDQYADLDFYSTSSLYNNSPRVDKSLHENTFRLGANQSLLVLISTACLVEKQQLQI